MGVDIAPRVESWEDTPNQFAAAMHMDPSTPIFRPQEEWVDNEFDNYQRSYNNETWNPAGAIARSNAYSRDMGAIMNTYLQVNPIEKLTLRTQFGANAHYRRTDKFTPKFTMDALEKQIKVKFHVSHKNGWIGTGQIPLLILIHLLKSIT